MTVRINGTDFSFSADIDSGKSIVEFAHNNGIEVPTLCFLKDCGNVAKCGLCGVMVNGKRALACNTKVEDGMEVDTAFIEIAGEDGKPPKKEANPSAPQLSEFLQKRLGMMLDSHNFACGKCVRKDNCEFLDLVKLTKARANERYAPDEAEVALKTDTRSVSITIDRTKCVGCARCSAACAFNTTTQSISGKGSEELAAKIGMKRAPFPAIDGVPTELGFDETNCLLCGQCVLACPVGALQETDDTAEVEAALENEKKHVVVAIAPAVRAGLGELFGLPQGTDVTGKIYTALREIGFDRVFDINFTADVTIMEEGTELLTRLGVIDGAHGDESHVANSKPKLPMFTSCCPGWIRLVHNYAPELKGNLSTAKSPQQIFGAAAKHYYPSTSSAPEGLDPKDVFVVTIMPCTAKKFEAAKYGMNGADGSENNPDIDAVLTTRELARLIKSRKIAFTELEDGETDPGLGEYTGAGTIFGVTGGVMEAALRSAKDLAEGVDLTDVDYEPVTGFCGVREATVNIAGNDVKVAVINGAANFFAFKDAGMIENYHFIEVMSCPGGCVNGGGQPHVDSHSKLDEAFGLSACPISLKHVLEKKAEAAGHNAGFSDYLPEYVQKRASVLRKQDKDGNFTDQKRKSHQNAEVHLMYESLGVKPGEGIAHELFHHIYE